MRHRFLLLTAVVLCLFSVMAESALTQQQQGAGAQGGSVQVGVPQGRGAAPAVVGARPVHRPDRRRARPTARSCWAAPSRRRRASGYRAAAAASPLKGRSPLQPWAQAVLDDRRKNQLEPHTRCKPSGVTRQFLTPYGVEFVDLPELQRVYIFDIGGPHTYRTIFMDGRVHPANLAPSYYGHSIGWWEGDTLVVDSIGFNEGFWMDRRGSPHTDKLHTLERFTRSDSLTMKYEVTIDDPGAYTATWKSGFDLRWEPGTELFEYVCQQANYAHELMVGQQKKIDRTSIIVP